MPNTYKTKVCATCGKAEGKHWARHWKQQHPSEMINELVHGQAPTQPLDINWLYLIKDKEARKLFMDGNKEVLPQTEDINQEDTPILNLGLPEARQDHPEAHDQSDQILQQDQMQV